MPKPPPNAGQVSTTHEDGSKGTVQDDLDAQGTSIADLQATLNPPGGPRLLDPGIADLLDTDLNPAPAAQTTDAHRLSFYLPNSDHTVFSLGAAGAAAQTIDTGIRGRTDQHIHFETTLGGDHTLVSLGGPATDSSRKSMIDAAVPKTSHGFAMLTGANAWMQANKQFQIMSREKDFILRALNADKTICVQADQGTAEMVAGKTATVAAKSTASLVADTGLHLESTKYGEDHKTSHSDTTISKIVKTIITARDVQLSWQSLVASYSGSTKDPKEKAAGWKKGSAWDKAKMVVDAAKIVSTVVREADSWASKIHMGTGAASASVTAVSGYASVLGGVSGSLYGHLSASVTSLLSASLLGGTASVKGLLWASVWGMIGTSVKAKKDASIEGETGKCSLKGKTEVNIACGEGAVKISGDKWAQVTSNIAVYMHAVDLAYFGVGKGGDGYGMTLDTAGIKIGPVSSADTYADAKVKTGEQAMTFKKGQIGLKQGKSLIGMRDDAVVFASGKIGALKVKDDGNVTAEGKKILIG